MARPLAIRVPLLAVIAALAAVPTHAQSTVKAGAEFRVNEFTTSDQFLPSVAAAPDGTYLVTWQSDLQDGDTYGVFGRFVSPLGVPLGPEFRVSQATVGYQGQPTVAADAAGRFTVAWTEADGSTVGIFARQFTPAGPIGPDFQVNVFTTGDQSLPRVSAGPSGLAVVWQSGSQDGSGWGVFGRLFTPAGAPVTGEFLLSQTTAGDQTRPVVAGLDNGRWAVAWLQPSTSDPAVYSRLFDASGAALRAETLLSSPGFGQPHRDHVTISRGAAGTFAVGWWQAFTEGGKDHVLSTDQGVVMRYHDVNGLPTTTDGAGGAGIGTTAHWQGSMALSLAGRFLVAYTSTPGALTCFTLPAWPGPFCTAIASEDGSGSAVFAKGVGAPGMSRVLVNTTTSGDQTRPSAASDVYGNGLVAWESGDGSGQGIYAQRFGGIYPVAVVADPSGNGVIDPGQAEVVAPTWRNLNGAAQTFGGTTFGMSGTAPGTYTVVDGTATYGTVQNGTTRPCIDCYAVSVTLPTPRPATHVDAYLGETLTPAEFSVNFPWTLHVGGSFADVAFTSPFYRFIETLLHRGVTTGCGGGSYCPALATTRDQMAVFVLVARQGAGYVPPDCGVPVFADVPASSPFCRWIEELVRRGVVAGCGGGNYCPGSAVSREQMAVFVLRTLDPALDPPACTTPLFADVPASSPFCRWIEELARRGVVTGCGGGNYCPGSAVTREQMAVFLSATFGLSLY